MRFHSRGARGLASLPSIPRNLRAAHLNGAAQVSGSVGEQASVPESRFPKETQPDTPISASLQRISDAARLGSSKIGGYTALSLNQTLEDAIAVQILQANKQQLRRDVEHWAALTEAAPPANEYGLAQRASDYFPRSLHGSRRVAMHLAAQFPARFAVITRVLDEVRRRIPGDAASAWKPNKVVDWNSQAFEGLWASLHVFGHIRQYNAEAWSKELLSSATGLLHTMQKQESPGQDVLSQLQVSMRLRGDKPSTLGPVAESNQKNDPSLGLYAYGLSALPDDAARERQVQRMWKSGADTLVLIEEATPRGFASIAAARTQLLSMSTDQNPCHVVAPCPHDKACPMLHPGTLNIPHSRAIPRICSYSQMYHAPSVTRATLKDARSDRIEEFCYVVIRRGSRPSLSAAKQSWSEAMRLQSPDTISAAVEQMNQNAKQGVLDQLRSGKARQLLHPDETEPNAEAEQCRASLIGHGVDANLVTQLASYEWPRIVRAPLKKGGHVTIDACCPNGRLERFTLAKSAGRQAYQDARKARQGDLFPHSENTGKSTIQRESAELNSSSTTHGSIDVSNQAYDHQYIGPDSQLSALTTGLTPAIRRKAARAPKRPTISITEKGKRWSRKPNRARLDEELNAWD
ncbi:37S ribosomal protein S22 [Malassezia yamatoensis]|uniref:37S ribosomal protein S22 n=1 Tax=Malassezia yamatoensis TaxID=253288 RepID=A0AAJ5YT06_9BASI|nr:37S ribosomal protein S22 [Malassezia yamatoensis]